MGMSDNQWKSHRRIELWDFEEMRKIAIDTNADDRIVKRLDKLIEHAKCDLED